MPNLISKCCSARCQSDVFILMLKMSQLIKLVQAAEMMKCVFSGTVESLPTDCCLSGTSHVWATLQSLHSVWKGNSLLFKTPQSIFFLNTVCRVSSIFLFCHCPDRRPSEQLHRSPKGRGRLSWTRWHAAAPEAASWAFCCNLNGSLAGYYFGKLMYPADRQINSQDENRLTLTGVMGWMGSYWSIQLWDHDY